ncbi:hypothetical protein RhiirA1_480911 [Rhizophagus irregularis]|uniref:Uncharacterized protein n=1 Tax=Rhizophagus irregularis TaxID=588596 RepID=A0A2N0QNR8_9GLOM|nr:hypothetical protein RhiirA1_480911 [Rhizophagus irregularis]
MREIQVWKHVLKWGLAQSPELPFDITNISKEDFKTLKNNVRQLNNSNEILGEYNLIAWESNESDESDDELDEENFGTTKDSFIFSFDNSVDVESYILSRGRFVDIVLLIKYEKIEK